MHHPTPDPATELLDVVNESELHQYLQTLIARTARDTGVTLPRPAQRAVAESLAATARATVPTLTLLSRAPGGMPARAEGSVAATAARVYGMELEGLSAEDRDLEIAREFVALVRAATARAAGAPVAAQARAALSAARIDTTRPDARLAAPTARQRTLASGPRAPTRER